MKYLRNIVLHFTWIVKIQCTFAKKMSHLKSPHFSACTAKQSTFPFKLPFCFALSSLPTSNLHLHHCKQMLYIPKCGMHTYMHVPVVEWEEEKGEEKHQKTKRTCARPTVSAYRHTRDQPLNLPRCIWLCSFAQQMSQFGKKHSLTSNKNTK